MTITPVEVGDFVFARTPTGIRGIKFRGTEILRGLEALIRDHEWGTEIPRISEEREDLSAGRFRREVVFDVMDGALHCSISFTCDGTGTLEASFKARAREAVSTCRAGLVMLHPLDGVVGETVTVVHADGNSERLRFPRSISPGQPFFDVVGLQHTVGAVSVDLRLDGEVFETEDQRNWTDGSYKTYSRPLAWGFPYKLEAGETIQQRCRLTAAGDAPTTQAADDRAGSGFLPEIGFAEDALWHDRVEAEFVLSQLNPNFLRWRFRSSDPGSLENLARLALDDRSDPELEVVMVGDREGEDLREIARRAASLGVNAKRVFALPELYLQSYQPEGPWPAGTTPSQMAERAADAFPSAMVAVGMMTHFTEVNRCRPEEGVGDYLTHDTSAIVHDASDTSVMETLEGLRYVFEDAPNLAGQRRYRPGLTAIGNRYGLDRALADSHSAVAQSLRDPRQRTAYGAAFAIGVLVTAIETGVEALTLASLSGPFSPVTRVNGAFVRCPLFHVLDLLLKHPRAPVQTVHGAEGAVVGVLLKQDEKAASVLANCSDAVIRYPSPMAGKATRLDQQDVAAPGHQTRPQPVDVDEVMTLAPYSVVVVAP